MAIKYIDDTLLTDIADAIRVKASSSDTYTPAEMAQAIEDMPGGEIMDALMAGTASGDIVLNSSGAVGPGLSIRISPLNNECNNNISSISLPNATSIGNGLIEFLANGNHNVPAGLKRLDFPLAESIGTWNNWSYFSNCLSGLESINIPKLKTIPSYFCTNARRLTGISAPGVSQCPAQYQSWQGCTGVEIADFGRDAVGVATDNPNSILGYGFNGCSNLKALVLRYTYDGKIHSLSAGNALSGTPIASGTGYIYVPRDLVATYQAATNWSTYANQFRAIEDYTADGTLTGDFVLPA